MLSLSLRNRDRSAKMRRKKENNQIQNMLGIKNTPLVKCFLFWVIEAVWRTEQKSVKWPDYGAAASGVRRY